MHDHSMTGTNLLDAVIRGDDEAVWTIAANEPYGELAYGNPRSIWPEVLDALKICNEEMADAIGTCLLEHMLQVDFEFFLRSDWQKLARYPDAGSCRIDNGQIRPSAASVELCQVRRTEKARAAIETRRVSFRFCRFLSASYINRSASEWSNHARKA